MIRDQLVDAGQVHAVERGRIQMCMDVEDRSVINEVLYFLAKRFATDRWMHRIEANKRLYRRICAGWRLSRAARLSTSRRSRSGIAHRESDLTQDHDRHGSPIEAQADGLQLRRIKSPILSGERCERQFESLERGLGCFLVGDLVHSRKLSEAHS